MSMHKTGIVLVNLGTPDAPEAPAIRRYLQEFLSDPRVVSLPPWLWLPILNLVILRVRPKKLVEKYKLIWGRQDGPIRNITQALADRLQLHLTEEVEARQKMTEQQTLVASAMTYGNPSIASRVKLLAAAGVGRLLFVPLYPQYASATTGSVADRVELVMRDYPDIAFSVVKDYHQNHSYLLGIKNMIANSHAWRTQSPSENDGALMKPLLIFSFHGIPQAQSDAGDPYRQQCETTASSIAKMLNLAPDQWRLTFQSRFGPAKWLQPYTDETLASLPSQGITNVLIVCPGFSVDCLETLEEIKVLNREIFLNAGGKSFSYVKALNATRAQVSLMQSIVAENLVGVAMS